MIAPDGHWYCGVITVTLHKVLTACIDGYLSDAYKTIIANVSLKDTRIDERLKAMFGRRM